MKFIATPEALKKLNIYKMTWKEVEHEFKDMLELQVTNKVNPKMYFNMKNLDLIILPIGKSTGLIFEYGIEFKGSYEDMPEIKYTNDKWHVK